MTDLNLDAIEARANAATEGPWESLDRGDRLVAWRQRDDELGIAAFDYVVPEPMDNADDAEFIAHARTDVPALVAEVRRLRDIEAEAYRRALDVIEAEREDETVALTDVGLVLAANAVRVLLNAAVTRGGAS